MVETNNEPGWDLSVTAVINSAGASGKTVRPHGRQEFPDGPMNDPKNPQGNIARWLEELSQYDMDVRHRPGYKHINADALSKMPDIDWCEYYR